MSLHCISLHFYHKGQQLIKNYCAHEQWYVDIWIIGIIYILYYSKWIIIASYTIPHTGGTASLAP